ALTLRDAAIAATVYESSDRIGGRMHSDAPRFGTSTWDNGQVSEWCGELIDQGHKTILHLAQRFGLATVDLLSGEPNGSEDTYYFSRQYYPQSQADTDFQPVHQALQRDVQAASYPTTYLINTPGGIALDNISVYDWIERSVPGGHGSPMGQPCWRMIAIGFNRVGSIDVTFSVGGQTVVENFDRVILALPFAVLRTLNYHKANFDSMKNTAIQQLGSGRNDKLQLQFTRRY